MSYLCGCYYHVASTVYHIRLQKHYLPLVDSEVHSTILSTTSRTVLKQKFTNPSPTDSIKECIYTFPLYDGVSVVDFTCRIGSKVLRGLVKEKKKAKQIFDQAVAKGETAGLLEQAPEAADVFSTKLGNIPAGETVTVEITYIGELKHHETEGIRFTIPTKIAPRYGAQPTVLNAPQARNDGGIKITVDVSMPEGSFIKGVQSPSHPIAVSMGTISTASNADPTMSKASATLALGSAALEKDFVLIVQSKNVGIPKALLETHPTLPNHRALMATLVPKFTLPPSPAEIVFVADRSGSMSGNIPMLISAMKVFLKSMPAGIKFNICSFGSSFHFLWPKSQTYSAETLAFATQDIDRFDANMGGTSTFAAIKATIENRYTDLPLEIILLTDGDIWDQNNLFTYVNQQVEATNGKIRIFPLGIGNGVSHSLIEGLARAGNGFAQAVQEGERLDSSVVRMLRGALSPHITDYTLEVKYEKEDDDFDLIDTVTEGMKVLLSDGEKSPKAKPEAKPIISLFDTSYDAEKDIKDVQESEVILPEIPIPKLLQAPHKIPSLFAFSRTTVYLLMSPETIQRNPTAVVLRGNSPQGPLALEIPIEIITTPGKTIHQLAAKKAVQDLEEGRGWLYDAKDQSGKLLKERYPSCFGDLVQKEAVRLGEKFQVAGKWCSFVAVAANDKEFEKNEKNADETVEQKTLVESDDDDEDDVDMAKSSPLPPPPPPPPAASGYAPKMFKRAETKGGSPSLFGSVSHSQSSTMLGVSFGNSQPPNSGGLFGAFGSSAQAQSIQQPSLFGHYGMKPGEPGSRSMFTSLNHPLPAQSTQSGLLFGGLQGNSGPPATGGLFGSSNSSTVPSAHPTSLFGGFGSNSGQPTSGGLFGSLGTSSIAQSTQSGSLFGAVPGATVPPAAGGLFGSFGSSYTNPPAQSTSLFGQNSGNFGQPTTGDLFDSIYSSAQLQPTPSTSLFGGLSGTSVPPTSGGLFGPSVPSTQSDQSSVSRTSTGGIFGNSSPNPQSWGASGSPIPTTNPFATHQATLFGTPLKNPPSSSTTTDDVGAASTAALSAFDLPTPTTLFGSSTAVGNTPSTGLFGASNIPASSSGTTPGSSLFGSVNPQQGPFQGFGSANSTTMASTNPPGTGLFGSAVPIPANLNSSPSAKPSTNPVGLNNTSVAGGLFGYRPPFPQANFQQTNTSQTTNPNVETGGLFGSSTGSPAPQMQQQQQPQQRMPLAKPAASYARSTSGSVRLGATRMSQSTSTSPPRAMPLVASPAAPGGPWSDQGESTPDTATSRTYSPPAARMMKKKMASPFAFRKSGSHSPESSVVNTPAPSAVDWTTKSLVDKIHHLIALQSFDGFWSISPGLETLLNVKVEELKKDGVDEKVWVTGLVVLWLEESAQEEEGIWGLVGEKGRGWLAGSGAWNESLEGEVRKVLGV